MLPGYQASLELEIPGGLLEMLHEMQPKLVGNKGVGVALAFV